MRLSRRGLLAGAVIPFAEWIKTAEGAGTPLMRYSATTTQGQAMLTSYATAVTNMKNATATTAGSPGSWNFQWYTHCVPNNTGGPNAAAKNAMLTKVYGSGSSTNKSLATEMWDTCQAHGGQDEDFFLPWHRMYVYYFERIVRKMSGNTQFTLPYWDYTIAGAAHGVIPAELQKSGALFVQNRNPGVNAGQAIDKGQQELLNLDALKETDYQQTGGTTQGFCMDLDSNLHGDVHVYTGTGTNMGQVPYAAGDPVFWLHHCNIDRIWASWNKNGGQNPVNDANFMKQTFVFADENGVRVQTKISDFLDIATLGYTYDKLEPKPTGFTPRDLTTRFQLTKVLKATPPPEVSKPVTVNLGAGTTSVELAPAPAAKGPLHTMALNIAPQKRVYLVARELSAPVQPGVVYHVYLGSVESKPVGSINFFAAGHQHGASDRFWSVDVTDRMKAAGAQGKATDPLKVFLVASGQPAEGAKPVIGSLRLVVL